MGSFPSWLQVNRRVTRPEARPRGTRIGCTASCFPRKATGVVHPLFCRTAPADEGGVEEARKAAAANGMSRSPERVWAPRQSRWRRDRASGRPRIEVLTRASSRKSIAGEATETGKPDCPGLWPWSTASGGEVSVPVLTVSEHDPARSNRLRRRGSVLACPSRCQQNPATRLRLDPVGRNNHPRRGTGATSRRCGSRRGHVSRRPTPPQPGAESPR